MARVILENVQVDFPIYGVQQRSLRTAIIQRTTGGLIRREGRNNERIVVRALSDVSLQLEEGDRLGLIGHNGSGKSTLLKVIAGIHEPITGTRKVEGRVTPLFDMMPGLDLEDSGYENIFTSGMLLGMSRAEIEGKIPEIEEFCELGEYLALPVRTYSAGMTMRLGFALVTAVEPGVLLIDEGLATSDLRFTERATKRMDDFIGRSRIIVLASHSAEMIKSMCNKAALLHEGRIIAFGSVDSVYERYEALAHADATRAAVAPIVPVTAPERPVYNEDSIREVGLADRLARTSGAVRITKAVARDESGKSRWAYEPGETVTFRFEYEVLDAVPSLALGFGLHLPTGSHADNSMPAYFRPWAFIVTSIFEVVSTDALEVGQRGAVELTLPRLSLMPNRLLPYVWLESADANYNSYDVIDGNVDLPPLTIGAETKSQKLAGVVSAEYELRKYKPERLATAVVTQGLSFEN
jgi:ABC-type polysaccharide/polyol phosphate transport system ATPase subunit